MSPNEKHAVRVILYNSIMLLGALMAIGDSERGCRKSRHFTEGAAPVSINVAGARKCVTDLEELIYFSYARSPD